MQSEMLLITRNATGIAHFLPLFLRTSAMLENRRDARTGYNDFDIILDPFSTYHWLFTTLHAPGDVPYLATMVIGC